MGQRVPGKGVAPPGGHPVAVPDRVVAGAAPAQPRRFQVPRLVLPSGGLETQPPEPALAFLKR